MKHVIMQLSFVRVLFSSSTIARKMTKDNKNIIKLRANLPKGRDAKPQGLRRFIKRYDSLAANRCANACPSLGRRLRINEPFATFVDIIRAIIGMAFVFLLPAKEELI